MIKKQEEYWSLTIWSDSGEESVTHVSKSWGAVRICTML
jgi:hypothetical protein